MLIQPLQYNGRLLQPFASQRELAPSEHTLSPTGIIQQNKLHADFYW